MKKIISIVTLIALSAGYCMAQDSKPEPKKKHHELTISSKGIYIDTDGNKDTVDSKVKKSEKHDIGSFIFDLGINFISDKTNYSSPEVQQYLSQIPAAKQNADLFRLRQEKSVNVNIYPLMESFRLMKKPTQRLYLTTGLGFQFYNFRYSNNITYTRNPSGLFIDSINFSKNKVAMNYLNVPLLLTYKTRLYSVDSGDKKEKSLVLGCGITGGYGLSIWSKQVSDSRGKIKTHDQFDFNNFNSCVMVEVGIDDLIRFYGTYQLTSLFNNGIQQHPYSIGIRLIGL